MTYSLGANLDGCAPPELCEEGVHGNSEGMAITITDPQSRSTLNVLWVMKTNNAVTPKVVKWEGMSVDEPTGEPFFSGKDRQRTSNLYKYYTDDMYCHVVPDKVISEKYNNKARISVKAKEQRDSDNEMLYATHEICDMHATVQYKYQ